MAAPTSIRYQRFRTACEKSRSGCHSGSIRPANYIQLLELGTWFPIPTTQVLGSGRQVSHAVPNPAIRRATVSVASRISAPATGDPRALRGRALGAPDVPALLRKAGADIG